MAITVCIVDDTLDIRLTLAEIVNLSDEFSLLGTFPTGGIECVRRLIPANKEILFMMCAVYVEDEKIL